MSKPDILPKIGDGVTIPAGSDCYPGTIVSVSESGLTFQFQRDIPHHKKGSFIDGNWEGTFEANPHATLETARWTTRKGVSAYRADGRVVGVGHRRFYQDPSF